MCRSVIAHLKARKETRWHSFAENLDYPEKDDAHWKKYVNSRMKNGKLEIVFRDLVEEGQNYEHCHNAKRVSAAEKPAWSAPAA